MCSILNIIKKKVLIVGINTTIGRELALAYLKNGYCVISTEQCNIEKVKYISDVSFIKKEKPDIININIDINNTQSVIEIVNNVIFILDEFVSLDNKKIVIHSSTGDLYLSKTKTNKEIDETRADNKNKIANKLIEDYIQYLSHSIDMQYYILRYSNICFCTCGLIYDIVSSFINNKNVIDLNLNDTIDFIYISDVISINILLSKFFNNKINNGIYNISSGDGILINSLINKIRSKLSYLNNKINFVNVSHLNNIHFVLNNDKVKNTFNWLPKNKIDDIIDCVIKCALH